MSEPATPTRPTGLPPAAVVALADRAVAGAGREARLVAHEPLKTFVHRLRFEVADGLVAVVVKRLSARRARVVELVLERWLPEVRLGWACPRLHCAVRDRVGGHVWHVYEDVGGVQLDCRAPDPARVEPVVELIAELHARFARHPLLAECRQHGEALGMSFFTTEVARSIALLRSIPASDGAQRDLRDRLLDRVEQLHGTRHYRLALHEACAGPDTLLHGDLWTTNTLLVGAPDGLRPRLIDWDHAGVGPATYDLSTFLYRFAARHRPTILSRYRAAAARRGRLLPADPDLSVLFDTAECARYACCLAEAALAAVRGERWGFEQLAEIDDWFARLEPVLAAAEVP